MSGHQQPPGNDAQATAVAPADVQLLCHQRFAPLQSGIFPA
jgi:hypothetical protein